MMEIFEKKIVDLVINVYGLTRTLSSDNGREDIKFWKDN